MNSKIRNREYIELDPQEFIDAFFKIIGKYKMILLKTKIILVLIVAALSLLSTPQSYAQVVSVSIILTPPTSTNPVGGSHTVTANVFDIGLTGFAGHIIDFNIGSGPNAGVTGSCSLIPGGSSFTCDFTYTDSGGAGTDVITATSSPIAPIVSFTPGTAQKTWTGTAPIPPGGGAVGGAIMPIDTTSLFVAGAFTNAFWILPTLGGIAGAAVALFKIKRRHS